MIDLFINKKCVINLEYFKKLTSNYTNITMIGHSGKTSDYIGVITEQFNICCDFCYRILGRYNFQICLFV